MKRHIGFFIWLFITILAASMLNYGREQDRKEQLKSVYRCYLNIDLKDDSWWRGETRTTLTRAEIEDLQFKGEVQGLVASRVDLGRRSVDVYFDPEDNPDLKPSKMGCFAE